MDDFRVSNIAFFINNRFQRNDAGNMSQLRQSWIFRVNLRDKFGGQYISSGTDGVWGIIGFTNPTGFLITSGGPKLTIGPYTPPSSPSPPPKRPRPIIDPVSAPQDCSGGSGKISVGIFPGNKFKFVLTYPTCLFSSPAPPERLGGIGCANDGAGGTLIVINVVKSPSWIAFKKSSGRIATMQTPVAWAKRENRKDRKCFAPSIRSVSLIVSNIDTSPRSSASFEF